MTMDLLPPAVIERVMSYLHPWDRLNGALTCRSWAQALSSASLMEDIWFVIHGSDVDELELTVMKSKRQYRNLRIVKADLSEFTLDFWVKVGSNLRRLDIIDCRLESDALYFILGQCLKLKSLTLKARSVGYLDRPDGVCIGRIQGALRNVQHLKLHLPLRAETLKNLLRLVPKARSLDISSPAHSPEVSYLLPCMLESGQRFTKLRFHFRLSGEQVRSLVEAYSKCLEVLQLDCAAVERWNIPCIGSFTRLRELTLINASNLGDDTVENVVKNNPNLESLTVTHAFSLTEKSLFYLSRHERLRHVALDCFSEVNWRTLGGMSMLQSLELPDAQLDFESIQRIACFENLRVLVLCNHMDSVSFQVIVGNLKKLEKLVLGSCESLTDEDGLMFHLLKHLKSLRISRALGFTERTYEMGLGSPEMESLMIENSPVSDLALAHIASHHGRLESLSFTRCTEMTEAGLAALFLSEPYLKNLELHSLRFLTSRSLEVLENCCPRLRTVQIYSIGELDVSLLEAHRPFVNVLHAKC